jgi:hypothetical protein
VVHVSVDPKSRVGNVTGLTRYRVALNVLYCRKVNKDKANGKYDQYTGYADDRDPDFIMVL